MRVRFPNLPLNAGSSPAFMTKILFNNKKIKKFGRAVTFIDFKSRKNIQNTIFLFFFKQKNNFLYILMYTEYSMQFFLVFFLIFFFSQLLAAIAKAVAHSPKGSSSSEGSS
jgi:hypothetical protein